uniref:AAA_11 domain-containing protein n=1 Tax=Macrostomum lignano TaxID=282301 RepID=A0A1I8FGD3_9PLAT
GPPGTGKSFLGVLLIRQILALPTLPHGPVLVMSYKNHALDEFLMDLMALPGMEDKVVRGWRVYEDAGQRQAQLKARLNHVSRLLSEPGVLVQEAATRAQLRTLLVNWRPSVLHQQKLRQEAIAEWKNLRKPIEDPEALAAWLDIPLVRQAVHTAVACWLPNKEERRQHAATAAASSNSAGAESVESHIARVLANFEQRFGQVLSGKAKSNKQQQQKQQQQQPTDDPVDDEDTEAAEFAMQQRQSAFMFQLGKKANHRLKFGQQDGLTAGGLMLEASSQTGRLAALRSDLWRLDIGERCDLLHYWLQEKVTGSMAQVETQLADYLQVSETVADFQRRHCAEIVKSKRIVGMTITRRQHQQRPAHRPSNRRHSLVEEAAEASHTISCELQNRICAGVLPPYSRISIPDSARQVLAVVSKHEQILCLEKSMYFWTPQLSRDQRSQLIQTMKKLNERCSWPASWSRLEEWSRAKITSSLPMLQGPDCSDSSVLEEAHDAASILPPAGPSVRLRCRAPELPISVLRGSVTKGDENDVIIVSLVRVEPGSRLGFLKDLSRRCVASVTRPPRGCIISAMPTVWPAARSSCWRRCSSVHMTEVGCLGRAWRLVCPRIGIAIGAWGFPTQSGLLPTGLCDLPSWTAAAQSASKLCRSRGIRHKNWRGVSFLSEVFQHRTLNLPSANVRLFLSEPCPKRLSCGHACSGECGDPLSGNPPRTVGPGLESERFERGVETAGTRRCRIWPAEAKGRRAYIKLDPGSSEFLDIRPPVTLSYVQMTHGWFPKFDQWSVAQVEVRMRFLNPGMFWRRGSIFGPMLQERPGACTPKGSRTLLLCEVCLAGPFASRGNNSKYNWKSLRQENYDSIFAPRDTKNSGGVLFDEFVGPKRRRKCSTTAIANSHFLSSFQGGQMRYKVTEVWHKFQSRLEHKFAAKPGPSSRPSMDADHQYAQYVLAFHGTKTAAIVDDI